MLQLRAAVNLTSTLARGAAFKRAGSQLVGPNRVKTVFLPRRPNLVLYAGLAGAGIGLHAYRLNNIHCDSMRSISLSLSASVYASPESPSQQTPPTVVTPKDSDLPPPPPPTSSLNLYELTFGSVCGICAGVFIKKGAKFVAFILGGTFVLLQVTSISRMHAFPLTPPPTASTSDLFLSSESTGLVPRADLRTYSIGRRTVLGVLPLSDLFGIGLSTFWPPISNQGPLSWLGWHSVCESAKLHVSRNAILLCHLQSI